MLPLPPLILDKEVQDEIITIDDSEIILPLLPIQKKHIIPQPVPPHPVVSVSVFSIFNIKHKCQ